MITTYVTYRTFKQLLNNTLKKGASNDEINKLIEKLNICICDYCATTQHKERGGAKRCLRKWIAKKH